MIKGKVSKMGNQLLVGVTGKGFELNQILVLKPKNIDVWLFAQVVKHGERQIVIIPKDYHQFFERGNTVYITRV